jgi:hypothetical protein
MSPVTDPRYAAAKQARYRERQCAGGSALPRPTRAGRRRRVRAGWPPDREAYPDLAVAEAAGASPFGEVSEPRYLVMGRKDVERPPRPKLALKSKVNARHQRSRTQSPR